jgi:hypothetical protein
MKLVNACLFCGKKCAPLNGISTECLNCQPGINVWFGGGMWAGVNFSIILIHEQFSMDFYDGIFYIRKFFGGSVFSKLYPKYEPLSLGINPSNALAKLKTYLIMI